VADLDAELRRFFRAARAYIYADRILRVSRPLEGGFIPAVWQFDDGLEIAIRCMNRRRVALIKAQDHAAERLSFEPAVIGDRFDLEADLVHVRDHENLGCFRSGGCCAEVQDQVSSVICFRFGPRRKETLYHLAYGLFVVARTVCGSEAPQQLSG